MRILHVAVYMWQMQDPCGRNYVTRPSSSQWWIFWSHDLYKEVETCFPRSFECSTLHSSCLVPGESWWCLTAAVRTLRTCLCCHLAVCFFQGLHRAGPTSHVHCGCWMIPSICCQLFSISFNIIQYYSISIQYLFKIYLYICIYSIFMYIYIIQYLFILYYLY